MIGTTFIVLLVYLGASAAFTYMWPKERHESTEL